MKRKVDIKKVEEVLNEKGVDHNVILDVVNSLSHEDQEEDTPKDTVKKEFAIIISDPNGQLPDVDFVGWAVQIEEGEAPHTVMDKVHTAGYEYNTSRKGRKFPVSTIGEIMEAVPARFCKEAKFWKKTPEPVLIVKTDNKLPMDVS